MHSKFSFSLVAVALFSASHVLAGEQTSEGCFSSSTGLTYNSTDTFNSKGYCGTKCLALSQAAFGLTNSTCWCGDKLPPASTKQDDSDCTDSCPGYPSDLCGGSGLWNLYLTGLTTTIANADEVASDTSTAVKSTKTATPTTSASPSVVTIGGQTVIVTATGVASVTSTAASTPSSGSNGPSKVGIAVGVVLGIAAIGAIAGGAWFFFRRRRNQEVEEEYRRNAAVSNFIAVGGKPPGSIAGSFADTRLEPAIMAHRRMSDGSIADNQDYSRRILKVTNA